MEFFIEVVVFVTALTASSKVEYSPKVKQSIENSFLILCSSQLLGISLKLKGTNKFSDLVSKSLCCLRYSFKETLVSASTTSFIVTLLLLATYFKTCISNLLQTELRFLPASSTVFLI